MGTKESGGGYKTIGKFSDVVRRVVNTPGIRQKQILTFLSIEGRCLNKVDISRLCSQAVLNGFLKEVEGAYYPGDIFLNFVKKEIR
jgi:hypothetical protein